ncbi:unnamed protein product [Amoebophrya sp. A120]|nr:unnamed protein product [Amoebophrya sp. A120]|eukprot:GSA120T00022867001.1
MYEKIQQCFVDRFGKYSGWAHSVLFAAELPAFRQVVKEVDEGEV